MPHKNKKVGYRLGFNALLRWIFFIVVLFFLFRFFNKNNGMQKPIIDNDILGETMDVNLLFEQAYQLLPPVSRQKFEKFPSSTLVIDLKKKYYEIIKQFNGFPQKQLTDLKKEIIKNITNELTKSLNSL